MACAMPCLFSGTRTEPDVRTLAAAQPAPWTSGQITQRQDLTSFRLYGESRAVKPPIQVRTLIMPPRRALSAGEVSRSGKVPRGLKPRGFPDDPSPRFRGGIQARVSSSGVLTCRLCRVSRRGCVVSILRSPRLVSWGSSPGVPDPWYWLTFYAGSLPVPATAYVRRLDRTGNGPVIKDRLFLSTFVGTASSTALERAWHPPRFIGEVARDPGFG